MSLADLGVLLWAGWQVRGSTGIGCMRITDVANPMIFLSWKIKLIFQNSVRVR